MILWAMLITLAGQQARIAHADPPTDPSPPDAPAPEVMPLAEAVAPAATSEPTNETVVRASKPRTAASASVVRQDDLRVGSRPRTSDFLSAVPNVLVIQHAGGGKANQYFLRGFDADHGTDVLLTVDGVPVNKPSHGHGQGYADLHFVIPELIQNIDVRKGPYYAEVGDFATAGAIDIVTMQHVHDSFVSVATGGWLTKDTLGKPLAASRALVLAAPDLGGTSPFVAAEVLFQDGPFENPEDLERFNLFARAPLDLFDWRLTLTGTSYVAGWNASGQVPLRAVKAGTLDRFGTLDETEGGDAHRHSIVARLERIDEDESWSLRGFLVHDRLSMFSNFTFFSRDPEHGDQIEQTDARTIAGMHARYRKVATFGAITSETTFGAQLRNDLIDNGLFYSERRERLETVVDASITQGSLGLYAEEELALPPWARVILGVRADGYGFQVDGTEAGTRTATIVSPKGSLILSWPSVADLFVNAGAGFHSNDARGVMPLATTPLTRALGGEVGTRTKLFDKLELSAAIFALHLEGETVWVGDEGTTELRGPTLRTGVEIETKLPINDWLSIDLDATMTDGRYIGSGDAIALAPTTLLQSGLAVDDLYRFFGRLGAVWVADRPATEDRVLTADGFLRFDAVVGWKTERMELALDVQNLTNTEWREAQFANVSRLPTETTPADCARGTRAVIEDGAFIGCEDIHFTPGAPLNARLSATFRF